MEFARQLRVATVPEDVQHLLVVLMEFAGQLRMATVPDSRLLPDRRLFTERRLLLRLIEILHFAIKEER